MRVGGVLLASGQGKRFGSNKLLAEVEGVPLYRRAMDTLAGAGLHRLAVCSPYPEILAAGENSGFLPLRNEHAAEGISASVRLGLSAMADLDGVLFAVCDQPYLTIFPGLAIVITIISLTLMGDGLRDALDPRMKR